MIENQDNPKQPFIARVDRFFEDTKKETDQKRVLVDWYLRLEDTSQIRNRDFNSYHIFKASRYFLKIFKKKFQPKKSRKRKSSIQAEKDEIFLYTGNAIPRNIDAEAIIWKCFVYNFKYRNQVTKERKNDKLYFCRKQFDAKKGEDQAFCDF